MKNSNNTTNTMIKKLLLSMVVSLIAMTSLAQTIVIKGTVKDFDGGTLPGARISEEGTTNYTLADVDGNYKIEVQPNAILGFAMSNYNPLFVSVNQGIHTVHVILLNAKKYKKSIIIKGTVKDFNNNVLPGVKVSEKGTSNFTTTDATGNYTIVAKRKAKIIFAKPDYIPVTYKDEGKYNFLDVKLSKK